MSIGTRAHQQKVVSAGVALGLAALDRDELPGNKVSFDLGFMGAWRGWNHTKGFTSVGDGALRAGRMLDPWWLVTTYDREKRTPWVPVCWGTNEGGNPTVYLRELSEPDQDWTEQAGYLVDSIPGTAWVELTQRIIDRVERRGTE